MVYWNYSGVADITIGEVHRSKAPKIILISLAILIVALTFLTIYFWEYIRDFFITPEIVLSSREISIELNSTFDAESYIISKNGEYSILGDDIVDTSVLNAEYIITYNVWNKVNKSSTELKVRVVDDTAPVIKLKSNNKKIELDENNSFTLVVGKSVDNILGTKDFDISKDISVEVSDNHTSKEDLLNTLKITPEKPDLTLDKDEFSKNVTISYEITDEVGLTATEHLLIIVVNGISEIPQPPISSSTTSSSSSTTTSTTSTSNNTPPFSSTTSTSSNTPPPASTSTNTPSPPPAPSTPYINGVHDITVKVGTGLQTIVEMLIDGVYGSGYVTCEYRRVNPTIAGVYPVTFTSNDGVTKTCTVTVVD